MSELDDFVGRCRAAVIRWAEHLPADGVGWAMHLIDHDEAPEAMNSLAWLIVQLGVEIDDEEIHEIRELIGDLVPDESLPRLFRASG
jgi:hypothetical protein